MVGLVGADDKLEDVVSCVVLQCVRRLALALLSWSMHPAVESAVFVVVNGRNKARADHELGIGVDRTI